MSSTSPDQPPKAPQRDPSIPRPDIAGPDDAIEEPYPIKLRGPVQKGFGRGSKELDCPTANLPDSSTEDSIKTLKTGVHFGYARVQSKVNQNHIDVYPMVMSIGYNPFYQNKKKTSEVHVIHNFDNDFYGDDLRVIILGYIRPEYDYTSLEALKDDIDTDKRVAQKSLDRPVYKAYSKNNFFFTD